MADDRDDETVTFVEDPPRTTYNDQYAERADCLMNMALQAQWIVQDGDGQLRSRVLRMMDALIGQTEREGKRLVGAGKLDQIKGGKTE